MRVGLAEHEEGQIEERRSLNGDRRFTVRYRQHRKSSGLHPSLLATDIPNVCFGADEIDEGAF